ncbi:MAG: hypothetical protein ACKVT0_12915 [Planctomycetaceae bacterium]
MDDSAQAPAEIWADYFSKRTPDPNVVRELILKLHQTGRHEHVIAAIEASILNNQSQPWMYEVLALSMEISGRPQAEVERVLLSQVDFTAADVPSMIFSAAYLNRLGADERALKMYKQSSRLDPTRSEPYILGLKLARQLKDWESVGWGAAGILETAWVHPDFQDLMQKAEDAAVEAQQGLEATGDAEVLKTLQTRMAEARRQDLVVKLDWSGKGDVDLIIEEPKGTVCSFQDRLTSGGGVLVHDGYGPEQTKCHEDYVCMRAWPGTYRIHVRHVSGEIVGKRAKLTVIRNQGTDAATTKTFSAALSTEDQIFRIEVPDGRRTAPMNTNQPQEAARGENNPKQSGIELVGHRQVARNDRAARDAKRRFEQSRKQHAPLNAFGAAYQPVISTLAEGAALGAMAVISGDRRYVRLSLSPNFSSVTDIFTFSFINSGNANGGGNGGNQNGQ